MMRYLILSTLPTGEGLAKEIETVLRSQGAKAELVETADMKISHCIGCNDCWIKTPGICCIKDDYEEIFKKMLQSDRVIFVAQTRLGFIHSKAKHLFDRILPMITMYLQCVDGQLRHTTRYGDAPDMALLYVGQGDKEFLNHWLYRAVLNLHGKSLGAFPAEEKEAFYHALGCH